MEEYQKIVDLQKKLPHYTSDFISKKKQLYYQYRDFKSFWSILESDSFWATNALFCNDTQEQNFGKKVISDALKNPTEDIPVDVNSLQLDENYIVCFCMEDDKLSQWRGYASKGGVSMGYDFHFPQIFSILDKETDMKDIEKSVNCVNQYAALEKVKYIALGDQYYEKLDLTESAKAEDSESVLKEEIRKRAPYIKHKGFQEENECRIVFSNYDGSLNDCVRRRSSASGLLQYPYIVVSAYQHDRKDKECNIRVCVKPEKETDLVNKIDNAFKEYRTSTKSSIHPIVFGCHLQDGMVPDMNADFCKGCTVRKLEDIDFDEECRYKYPTSEIEYGFCLGSNYCVMISAGKSQKEVYEVVHKCVGEFNRMDNEHFPVWCEGHLPLRSLTVGPCPNQDDMVTAISHYCKHVYWLRDVEIKRSNIPYRESM